VRGHHKPGQVHKFLVHFAAQHDIVADFKHEITLEQIDEGRRLYQHYIKKRNVREYFPSRPEIPCSPGDGDNHYGSDTMDGDHARAVTQPDPPTFSDDERERADERELAEPELRMSPEKLPFSYRDSIPAQERPRIRVAAVPAWTASPILDSDAVIPKGSCGHCLGQGHSLRHCPQRKQGAK